MGKDNDVKTYFNALVIPHCGDELITLEMMRMKKNALYLIKQLEGADRAMAHDEQRIKELEEEATDGFDQLAISERESAILQQQLDAVRKEGICLWNWAHNWDSPFIEDEHWRVTDAPRIYAALNGEGEQNDG